MGTTRSMAYHAGSPARHPHERHVMALAHDRNRIDFAAYTPRHFRWSLDGKVATITLDRPDKKNPLTFDSYADNFPSTPNVRIFPGGQKMLADNVAGDELVVPPGHYFAMGDNRDNSSDSRVPVRAGGVGMLPVENLVGRVDAVL